MIILALLKLLTDSGFYNEVGEEVEEVEDQ